MSINPSWQLVIACASLLAMTVGMYAVGRLPGVGGTVVAAGRMILQLTVVALVILTAIRSLPGSLALLAVMFLVAIVTTVRRIGAPAAWPWATVAIAAGAVPVVLVILLSGTIPPTGVALIPVLGILQGNTMNGHTLVCRRAFEGLREEIDQYDAWLSLGFRRRDAILGVIHRRVPEALIPGLDQVKTAGLVTLPGSFIGVLLGGGTPAQAAAAQVLVLLAVMAAQTITAVVAERLIASARLLPPDLKERLRP